VRKLNFSTQPDYKYLMQLFRKLDSQQGWQGEFRFDWDQPAVIPK
jgi:hypothetical protein